MAGPALHLFRFHPVFNVELILYEDGKDNRETIANDLIRRYLAKECDIEKLDATNQVGICDVLQRRLPNSPNLPQVGTPDRDYKLWLRFPSQPTTPDQRQNVLRVMKEVLLDHFESPPPTIATADHANSSSVDEIPALDDFFLDEDIEKLIKFTLGPTPCRLNKYFHKFHQLIARKCWSSQYASACGQSLGIPLVASDATPSHFED